jgi:hypothetical protein
MIGPGVVGVAHLLRQPPLLLATTEPPHFPSSGTTTTAAVLGGEREMSAVRAASSSGVVGILRCADRLPARIGRQMRLNLRKLPVRQPEPILIHLCSLSEAVNHNAQTMPRLLWVRKMSVHRHLTPPWPFGPQRQAFLAVKPIDQVASDRPTGAF